MPPSNGGNDHRTGPVGPLGDSSARKSVLRVMVPSFGLIPRWRHGRHKGVPGTRTTADESVRWHASRARPCRAPTRARSLLTGSPLIASGSRAGRFSTWPSSASARAPLADDRRGRPTSERRGRREECTAGVGHSEERTGDVFGAAPPRDQIGECVPSREADPALSGRSSERADSRDGMPGSSSSLIQVFENKRCGARLVFVYLVEEMPSSPTPTKSGRP